MSTHHPPYRGYLFRDSSKTDGFGHYHPSGTVEEVTADLPHRAELLGASYGELFRLDKDGNQEKKPFVTFTPKAAAVASARKTDGEKVEAPSGPQWRARFYKDSSKGDLVGTCYPSGDEAAVKADLAHRSQAIGAGYGELYKLDEDGKEGEKPHATFGGSSDSSDSGPAAPRRGRKPGSSATQPAANPAADEVTTAAEKPASATEKPASSPQGALAPKKPGRKPSTPPRK